jgi:type VI secretion system protein ImpK
VSTLTVGRAAELARRGDLADAAALLEDESSAEALDLLARVRAQQKRWPEADECWRQVQSLATDGPLLAAAADGRRTVARIVHHRRAARPVLPVVGVVAVAALLVGGLLVFGGRDEKTVPIAQPTVTRTVQVTQPPTKEEAPTGLATVQQAVAGSGAVVRREPAAVQVSFVRGLFTSGTDLSPAGRSALVAVGKRLRGLPVSVTVTGYSVVVHGSAPSGGSRTGLQRARVAVLQLSAASGLPLTSFSVRSGDQAHPPYRTDAQNRTVTITLTADQG